MISLKDGILKEAMENTRVKKGVIIDVVIPKAAKDAVGSIMLEKEAIASANKAKQPVTVKVGDGTASDYSITIPADRLEKMKESVDLQMSVKGADKLGTENKALASMLTKVLKSSNGKMENTMTAFVTDQVPGMTLSYNVTEETGIKPGGSAYLYRFNKKTNKLEEVANNKKTVAKDGSITTRTLAGGAFVVSAVKLEGTEIIKLTDKVKVQPSAPSVAVGKKITMKATLPDDLVKVDSFTKNEDPFGQEEAKITYLVSDKKIATVSKDGTLTAKAAGKIKVTAIVLLENKEKKTFEITVDVKK